MCGRGCCSSTLISIHVLREEDDRRYLHSWFCLLYFYPRPPRGGRRVERARFDEVGDISIHVLREEDDLGNPSSPRLMYIFLSTSSARRTTSSRPARR